MKRETGMEGALLKATVRRVDDGQGVEIKAGDTR